MKSFSKFSIFYNKHGLRHGFSLVEMLMALLVASLLLAALAPVMTKRMNEKVNFEGVVENPVRHKIVYLTEPGNGEWEVPNGIRQYKVTAVGAGGGGGAGSNYGCVVFTTTATPTGSLLSNDAEYCEHVRTDGNANFTIPDGIDEIYVSLISGAGGGGAGSAKWGNTITYDKAGTYTWNVPEYLRGDRILVTMNGGGGGGGGSDQGGAGGGASGGYIKPTAYDVPSNKTTIAAVVGGGGKGGSYLTVGAGGTGKPAGSNGKTTSFPGMQVTAQCAGGGGGGASNFDNGKITAFGGGGGAGTPWETGWLRVRNTLGIQNDLWNTVFNYGGSGVSGGTCGPYAHQGITYGGASGGNGGEGDGVSMGGNGSNGSIGSDGNALGASRGGSGGAQGTSGQGRGGYGQDRSSSSPHGGSGGGGAGSYFGAGSNTNTNCGTLASNTSKVTIAKAGTGAGGAGGSCGYYIGGSSVGGDGGDGIIKINYLAMNYGGTGGQSGLVIPRSRVALTNSMKNGSTLTINIGRGGKGGDRVIAYPNGNNIEIRTMNSSGVINSTTNLNNAKGAYGTASGISFGSNIIADTKYGGCGGGYQTTSSYARNCEIVCGTVTLTGGVCNTSGNNNTTGWTWHGHTLSAVSSSAGCGYAGATGCGGNGTTLVWNNGANIIGAYGGTISSKNGNDAPVARGGGGSYYGGYGGKGGDGYVKIEWGIPRNIDRTEAERYAGGGGAAGETITRYITVSPITRKIKYTIGTGGAGGNFDSNALKMTDGVDGGNTVFGNGGSYGFDTITAKGGKGGKSVKITSTYDSYFTITSLTGTNGDGGIVCTDANKCSISLNGKSGNNNIGGDGGNSNTGIGGKGGSDTNINGLNALEFDGKTGGGAGGGGGASGNNSYGKGGKGANGYIKIEYDD